MGTTRLLPSGRTVVTRDLSPWEIATTAIPIPNTALRDVLGLLTDNTTIVSINQQIESDKSYIRGAYEVAALWLEEPRLVLRGPVPDGAIGPGALPWGDVCALYAQFRLGYSTTPPTADDRPAGAGETPALFGERVSDEPE